MLTRDKDMSLGVRERGIMAANWGANLFISEHTNATGMVTNTTVRGVDVYSSVDLNDGELAKKFSKAISTAMGTKDGGGKKWESEKHTGEDYLGVIDAAQDGGVPHVILIESGFHDNVEDEKILLNPDKREAIAEAQFRVICEFYNIKTEEKKEEKEGVDGMEWKKKIVQEALEAGLITDKNWIEKADETATVWFVLAVALNLLKKLTK
jgi:N-acetylmuramoyl-L-alanine amidase